YLEEVEKYFKPGSVTEKKTYFEELFRRRALLSQSSSDCQDGANSQASNDGFENTDYEEDFEHASENEGYAERFEHVNEVGHSARFDENYDSSTHLSKNEKYQDENTGYDGDSERVNEVGDSARFEESFDGSNNGDIEFTEFGGEGSSNRDIEVIECGGEDSISCHSGPQTEQDTNSFDVLQSVPECLEAAKFNLSAGNSAFNDLKVSSGSKANVLNQHKSSEEQLIARKVVASRASCTEKVSHKLYQSVN
ncbi:protein WVD2-like 7, partial [Capsicum annuum]|uniref:protein WVD2-like 7 n=1 Tax=Capsicum annuum TaxID=4072 RepID=UPI001FB131EB